MRFRVVSLPATISVMKKRLSSGSVSRSPSISAFTSAVMMSSRGFCAAVGRHLVAHHVHLHRRGLGPAGDLLVVGIVTGADEVVRQRDHPRPHLGLEADHLADDLHRHLGGDLLDELRLALLAHVVDHRGGAPLDVLDELRDHPRREALRHQPPVAVVLGRVHHRIVRRRLASASSSAVGMNVPPSSELKVALSWLTAFTSACLVSAQNPVSSTSGCQHTGASARMPVELVVGHPTPPGGGEQVDPVDGRGHRHRHRLVSWSSGRGADGASEGGDRGAVVDGGWVDAAHHLEADQHADHGGARRVGRARGGRRRPPTRRRPRRRSPTPPRSGGRGAARARSSRAA